MKFLNKVAWTVVAKQRGPIFCIGFNRSGTGSLHSFFRNGGLRSVHNSLWSRYSYIKYGWLYYLKTEAYTDGPAPDFVQLQQWFPRAVFIYQFRDEYDWLISRVKLALDGASAIEFRNEGIAGLRYPNFGEGAKELLYDPYLALKKWLVERRLFEIKLSDYFRERNNLLMVDITNEIDWTSKISNFLFSQQGRMLQNNESVWENRLSNEGVAKLKTGGGLGCYSKIASEVIEELDLRNNYASDE